MSKGLPTPDFIQQTTETAARFIQWIAALVRRRKWFMLLVLLGVVLALIGSFLREQLNARLISETVRTPFWTSFWTVTTLVFIGALVVAIATMPDATVVLDSGESETKAIKGLRPFSREDAAVFSRLQREVSLRECCETLTSDTYKFGILMGESGCGKTSFLQAGVWPKLTTSDSSHSAVYVRFTDQEPATTVCDALSEQLGLSEERLESFSLPMLLSQASDAVGKPLVLLFDQFEQFFVHNPRKEERALFVQALNIWYRNPDSTVKILVSIRADLLHELYELHESLQYTLGPQDLLKLERFTPEEATNILAIVAEDEGFSFDPRFVTEIAEKELAHRESGTISPVDLQVLSWMIAHQKNDELRAFNRTAFQKLGGVEGLLSRFLERTLEPRILPNQRQVAIKTLQALTDLDRQVRAGVLTVEDIQLKLKGTAKPQEIEESVVWLSRSDVRLITPQNKGGGLGYELAHERLIPALMTLAGKELTAADRANKLLDRRVNEWLGNQRSTRYLLGCRELLLIQRQKPYLIWSTKRKQKEQLIRLSRRRTYRFSTLVAVAILVLSTFYSWMQFTPSGQIQQVRWTLTNRVERISLSDTITANVANAFIKDKQHKKGIRLIQNRIRSEEGLALALRDMTQTAVRTSDLYLLSMGADASSKFEVPDYHSYVLLLLAEAYGRLGVSDKAQSLLERALTISSDIEDINDQFRVLDEIAKTYDQLGEEVKARKAIENMLNVSSEASIPDVQSEALRLAAVTHARMGESDKAQLALEKALSLSKIVSTGRGISLGYRWRDAVEATVLLADIDRVRSVLDKALNMTAMAEIKNTYPQIEALGLLSNMYAQIGDFKKARSVLQKALTATPTIETDNTTSHSSALNAVARAAGKLSESNADESRLVLEKLLTMIVKIDNAYSQDEAFKAVARATGKLGEIEPEKAQSVLEELLTAIETIETEDYNAQSQLMAAVAEEYAKLGESEKAQSILEKASAMVVEVRNTSSQDNALSAIASAASKIEESDKAQSILEKILPVVDKQLTISGWSDDSFSTSNALGSIVAAAAQLKDVDIVESLLEQSRQVAEKRGASSVLSQIAIHQAFYGNWKAALTTLRTCLERDRMLALSEVLARYAESQSPALIDGPIILSTDITQKDNNKYDISVTIQSPNEGCNRYADWWEAITEEGELLHRKILDSSQGFEHQFTSNALIDILDPDQTIIIRGHFSEDIDSYRYGYGTGYTTQSMKGQVSQPSSFQQVRLPSQFAARVERQGEQPKECKLREE